MTYKTLSYETSGDIATVTLKQPYSDMGMVRELTAVCDNLEDENPCKAVVFQGCSEYFSRGINFSDFKPDAPMDIHGFNKWEKMCSRIERLPKVTVAALQGDVIGGGFQLALLLLQGSASQDLSGAGFAIRITKWNGGAGEQMFLLHHTQETPARAGL